MQNVIGIRTLRRGVNEALLRVARGETIVLVRHGRPVAILRPLGEGELYRRVSVTTFRRNLRRAVLVSHRRPITLTWYGDGAAVLAPVPPELELEYAEDDLL